MKVLIPTTTAVPRHVREGVEYCAFDPTENLPGSLRDAEVLVVWGMGSEQLRLAAQSLPRLRLVQLLSAGFDDAIAAGFAPDVAICSGRGLHDEPVAEHALALILATARSLPRALDAQHRHYWDASLGGIQPEPSPGKFTTLRGANVLLWGFGSIGVRLASHLASLGAHVRGVARSARTVGGFEVIAVGDIHSHLASTDLLVSTLPSSPETARVISREVFDALPPHAVFVNVGRGNCVNQEDLIDALGRGSIGAAALDVTDPEPLPENSDLWSCPNLIITPHAAGGRPLGADDLIVQNVDHLHDGLPLRNLVERQLP